MRIYTFCELSDELTNSPWPKLKCNRLILKPLVTNSTQLDWPAESRVNYLCRAAKFRGRFSGRVRPDTLRRGQRTAPTELLSWGQWPICQKSLCALGVWWFATLAATKWREIWKKREQNKLISNCFKVVKCINIKMFLTFLNVFPYKYVILSLLGSKSLYMITYYMATDRWFTHHSLRENFLNEILLLKTKILLLSFSF